MSNEATVKLKLLLQNHISTPLQRAKEQLNANVGEMKEKLSSLRESSARVFGAMKDEIPGLSRAIDLIKNPFVMATAGAIALGAAIFSTSRMALEWERGMAKINVTAQLTQPELKKLSNSLMSIGADNVAPLEQIPDAFNKIISAGLNVNQSIKALDPTLKAAKAGVADVGVVAAAGVAVMNSSGQDYNKVMDVLFATLNKGAAEFQDVATYLPKIVPGAKQAGFALGETAGAFAFLTAQGQRSEAAAMLLENAFKVLADPAKAASFKKMGVSIYDQHGKMLPLVNIVKQLSTELDGLTDEAKAKKLSSLGLDQQAATAFAVMTQNVGKLSTIIDATTNSSGALARAYTDSMTSSDMWAKSLNNVKVVLMKIGEMFLPIISWSGKVAMNFTNVLLPALVGVKNTIKEWWPVIAGVGLAFVALNAKLILTTAYIAATTVATSAWTAAQWLLNVALSANPIGLLVLGIGVLIGAVVVVVNKFEGWGKLWTAFTTLLSAYWDRFVDKLKYGNAVMWLDIQIFWEKLKGFGQSVGQLFTNIGQSIKLALTGNFAEARKVLGQKITTRSEAVVEVLEKRKTATESLYKSSNAARNSMLDEAKKNFANTHLTRKKDAADPATDPAADDLAGNGSNAPASPTSPVGDSPFTDPTDKVTGSAQQVRNITVNIDAFNKGGINTQNTNMQNMSGSQIEDWFTNAMMKVVRNLEMSY